MKYGFTDGPWYVCTDPKNDQWIPGMSLSSKFGRICDLFDLRVKEESDANGRLIAAAPELFDCVREWIDDPGREDTADRARELIDRILNPQPRER